MSDQTVQTWPNDHAPIQNVPLTSSDERMHELDENCWCGPNIRAEGQGDDFRILEIDHRRPATFDHGGELPSARIGGTMTAAFSFAVAPAATYRPAGILLRTLRLERWLCPACRRDNLVRRGSSIFQRPCRWCTTMLDSGAIPVVPGQTYRFECYARSSAGVAVSAGGGWRFITREFTLTRKAR